MQRFQIKRNLVWGFREHISELLLFAVFVAESLHPRNIYMRLPKLTIRGSFFTVRRDEQSQGEANDHC
jgi:hypothetical protein